MRNLYRIVALLSAMVFQYQSIAQEGGTQSPVNVDVTPKSPIAASLGSYGDIPVNYVSGRSSYSIPIFDFSIAEIKESLVLAYDYSGLIVDETPSWTGLGWTLKAGGVISRSVRGLKDEKANGFLGSNGIGDKLEDYLDGTMNSQDRYTYMRNIADGNWDSEPDIYSFQFGNESGRFVFNPDGEIVMIPRSTLKIVRTFSALGIAEFEVTDNNGTKYYFDLQEHTTVENLSSNNAENYVSSWFLTKIVSKNGLDEVTFSYAPEVQTLPKTKTESRMKIRVESQDMVASGLCGDLPISSSLSLITMDTYRLDSIHSKYWNIKFIPGANRSDVNGGKELSKVEISNSFTGEIIRSVDFLHDYFGSNKYLYLKEVQIDGQPPFVFSYFNESSSFPDKEPGGFHYNSRDHWGYYNANGDVSSSLIPDIWYMDGGYIRNIPGTDKSPNFIASRYGALKLIQYPTGGTTSFDYESHSFGNTEELEAVVQCSGPFTDNTYLENDGTDGLNLTKTTTFSISDETCLDIEYRLKAVDLAQSGEGSSSVKIIGTSGTIYHKSLTSTSDPNTIIQQSDKLIIGPGTYTVEAFTEVQPLGVDCEAWIDLNYNNGSSALTPVSTAGGIRIRKITSCPDGGCNNPQVKTFSYIKEKEFSSDFRLIEGTSTGRLFSSPEYLYDHTISQLTGSVYAECSYKVITSYSNAPLVNSKGSHVLYDEVSVYYGSNGEGGRTVYTYLNESEQKIIRFPFAPDTYQDHRRGLLSSVTHFKRVSDSITYLPIEKNTIEYEVSDPRGYTVVKALKAGYRHKSYNYTGDLFNEIMGETYSHKSEWVYPESKRKISYDQNLNDSLVVEELYSYASENHLQVTEEAFTYPTETKIKKYRYSEDFSNSSLKTALIDNNMITAPIEITEFKTLGTEEQLISGVFISYQESNLLPDQLYKLTDNTPVSNPTPNNSINSPDNPSFELEQSYLYDYLGRLSKVISKDGVEQIFIWGDNPKPLARLINASLNEVVLIDNQSNTTITWTPPNNKDYKVDYEYLSGGQWIAQKPSNYVQGMVAEGTALRNVRIYPSTADLVSYRYDENFNVIQQKDMNGVAQNYRYDDSNRLIEVSDHDGNILKGLEYSYSND